MRKDNNMTIQLQRYYALLKECTAMYGEWSKEQGMSSNGVFVLYSFYESDEPCTQKMISEKWNIPKQTINTILKDFQKKGYINMVSDDSDKRNKLICLTESGKEYMKDIIEKLHSKEIYVIEKMGLENIVSLNDNTELFIRLFKEGGLPYEEEALRAHGKEMVFPIGAPNDGYAQYFSGRREKSHTDETGRRDIK